MKDITAIILAAGRGKRMKSILAKVLHPIAGRPMLAYPIETARQLGCHKIVVVVGHQANSVKESFKNEGLIFVEQEEQLGTGHAVVCAREALKGFEGTTLILCGDVPLLKEKTIKTLVNMHDKMKSPITVLTVLRDNPSGYGRIKRDNQGNILEIVEEKDTDSEEKEIKEINTGIYCINNNFLFSSLESLKNDNAQGEYYLTDLIKMAKEQDKSPSTLTVNDPGEVMGINDRRDLARAGEAIRKKIAEVLMREGVTLVNPEDTYIDLGVKIGRDTIIFPSCHIQGKTVVGENCYIESGVKIFDSKIGNSVTIKTSSVITESKISNKATIGPFAHLRPLSEIAEEVKIGNFVEVKKSKIGRGSKVSHLSYIGDTTIGENVNIGAGTITCNYDGKKKHPTIIEDGVFVGSNTQLVAPVKIGKNSIVGAGSTITKNVPEGFLAIGRARQRNLGRL